MDRHVRRQDWAMRYRSQWAYADPHTAAASGLTPADQAFYLVPFYVYRQTLFDAVVLEVAAGTGDPNDMMDVGLYAVGRDQNARALLYSATGISGEVTGIVTTPVRWYVPAGMYYIGTLCHVSIGAELATIRRVTGVPYLGQTPAAPSTAVAAYLIAGTYTSLPSAASVSSATNITNSAAPGVLLRAI